MVLKGVDLFEFIRHHLHGEPGTPIQPMDMVNYAGQLLVSGHDWYWLNGQEITLVLRSRITMEDASWTEATLTLTSTGSFASYNFLEGDTIEITDGPSGVILKTLRVASRVDDDNITLAETISTSGDLAGGIQCEMLNSLVEFPGDFDNLQRITGYAAKNSLVNTMSLTTQNTLLELKTVTPGVSTLNFWGLVVWIDDPNGGPLLPRLSFWPDGGSTPDEEKFVVFLRGGWTKITTDTDCISLPEWLEPLYLEVLKVVASGYEEEQEEPMYVRFEQLRRSLMWRDAMLRDGTSQIDRGVMMGGATEATRRVTLFDQERLVAGPS